MAIGRVNTGGGGGKLFAIIAVTYPAGSVCTCSNGTRTLKAKDTSGKALFNVPSAGTWTVSCTDGSSTVSKSATITATGQVESVKLSYALVLYDSGDECTDITGGWIATPKAPTSAARPGNLSVTRGESSITITAPETQSQGGVFTPTNKIDLTSYSRLIFKGTLNNKTHDADYLKICIWSDLGTIWSNNLVASYLAPANTVTTNAEIDISSLTGEFVLGFALYNWSGYRPIVMMEDVFAE